MKPSSLREISAKKSRTIFQLLRITACLLIIRWQGWKGISYLTSRMKRHLFILIQCRICILLVIPFRRSEAVSHWTKCMPRLVVERLYMPNIFSTIIPCLRRILWICCTIVKTVRDLKAAMYWYFQAKYWLWGFPKELIWSPSKN